MLDQLAYGFIATLKWGQRTMNAAVVPTEVRSTDRDAEQLLLIVRGAWIFADCACSL